jgi:hypothetical protein
MRVQRMGGSEHWRGQGTDLLGSRATRGAVRLHLTESGSLFEFELGGERNGNPGPPQNCRTF